MQNMKVQFGFTGKSKLTQVWNLLRQGKIYTYLTEEDILTIWKQYCEYKAKQNEPTR